MNDVIHDIFFQKKANTKLLKKELNFLPPDKLDSVIEVIDPAQYGIFEDFSFVLPFHKQWKS